MLAGRRGGLSRGGFATRPSAPHRLAHEALQNACHADWVERDLILNPLQSNTIVWS